MSAHHPGWVIVQGTDMLVELAAELTRSGKELRLTGVHPPALAVLERAGVASRVPIDDLRDRITQSG